MIAYISQGPIGNNLDSILEYMRLSTCDQIGTHEFHSRGIKKGDFRHGDGWGMIWEKGGEFHSERKLTPYWETDISPDLRAQLEKSRILVIHARKRSPGKALTVDSVHPFTNQTNGVYSALVHNGTIPLDVLNQPKKFTPISPDSDTELFFYNILEMVGEEASIVDTLKQLITSFGENFSANYILVYGDRIYSSVNYAGSSSRPIYLGMRYLVEKERVVISSEIPPTITGNWKELKNGEILEIDYNNLTVTHH